MGGKARYLPVDVVPYRVKLSIPGGHLVGH